MTNAALCDATQKTPEEISYRAAIFFIEKNVFFTLQSCNQMISKF